MSFIRPMNSELIEIYRVQIINIDENGKIWFIGKNVIKIDDPTAVLFPCEITRDKVKYMEERHRGL